MARRLQAIHHRHLDVHEHGVKVIRPYLIQGIQAVDGLRYDQALANQELSGEFTVDVVVLHQEDAGPGDRIWGGALGRGRSVLAAEQALAAQDRDQGIQQQGGRDGLDQKAIDPRLLRQTNDILAAMGRHDHHLGLGLDSRITLDALGGLVAIHAGHAPIHEHQIEGGRGSPEDGQGLRPTGRGGDADMEALEHRGQDSPRDLVVVDHQYPRACEQPARLRHQGPALGLGLGGDPQGQGQTEGAALARLGLLDPDPTIHQFHQVARDGQTQAGAAKAAGGGLVCLTEFLEEAVLDVWGHADPGIAHADLHQQLGLVAGETAKGQLDLAYLGEFEGVTTEVQQDLADAQGVPHQHGGEGVVMSHQEPDALEFRLGAYGVGQVLAQGVEAELDRLDLHLAGLHLGEIQDVVEDAQERVGRALGLAELGAHGRRQIGLEGQIQDAEDGVHRRPDLVAHVGQEIRLHAGSLLGQFPPPPHLLDGGAFGADVVDDPDRALHRILAIDGLAREARPEAAAVAAQQHLFLAVGLATPDSRVDRIASGDIGLLLGVPEGGRLAGHLPRQPAEHLMQLVVATLEDAVLDQGDARGGGLQDGLLLDIGGAQGQLELLARREVGVGTHRPDGIAVRIAGDDLAPAQDPLVAAVPGAQPEFQFIVTGIREEAPGLFQGIVAVVRVEQAEPKGDGGGREIVRLEAEHGEVGGAAIAFVGEDIPVPEAVGGGLHGQRQALLAVPQLFLEAAVLGQIDEGDQ